MSPQGYKNMDLESQDPIFNANLGQDENLIWTKKLRCSHSILPTTTQSVYVLNRRGRNIFSFSPTQQNHILASNDHFNCACSVHKTQELAHRKTCESGRECGCFEP